MQSVILMIADSHDRLCQNSCYNANNHRENNGYLQDCIKILISFSFITFSIGLGDKYTHCRAEGKNHPPVRCSLPVQRPVTHPVLIFQHDPADQPDAIIIP